MNIQRFLSHHSLTTNPFVEEDAQTDRVFKEHCLRDTFHPAWEKIFGSPSDPSTSIVFGEKGSGKTAMRLQMVEHLLLHNLKHPRDRVFVIDYVDFNPFLDRFCETLPSRRRKPDRVLGEWKLWDHVDAILSLGTTRLVDGILSPVTSRQEFPVEVDLKALDRNQARDLLLLAACYDRSTAETFKGRWHRLRRRLRFRTWWRRWDLALCFMVPIVVLAIIFSQGWQSGLSALNSPWPYIAIVAGLFPRAYRMGKSFLRAYGVARHLRVIPSQKRALAQLLLDFSPSELEGQPLPNKDRTDDRFELLRKLQGILQSLGFTGIAVLVDRIDEPHLINGRADLMQAFLWPLLDNKLLKHPGIGFKLLLPIEVAEFLDREDRDFFQRARLDKQNMIPSLEWTGEALYDVASSRLRACAEAGETPLLANWFEEGMTEERLVKAFRDLRVPRHLFKFMYRLLIEHGNAHTDESPAWKISGEMFESVLAVYLRDQDQVDRGLRAG